MNPPTLTRWPVTLAQDTDDSLPPASTPGAPAAPGTANPAGDGTATTTTDGTTAPATAPTSPFDNILLPMLLVLGVLFVFSLTGGRKEKKRRAEMLNNLKKGNKVQTAGGVLGTIVEVRDDEVLVKVDENSNTRMRFAKSAITAVTNDE